MTARSAAAARAVEVARLLETVEGVVEVFVAAGALVVGGIDAVVASAHPGLAHDLQGCHNVVPAPRIGGGRRPRPCRTRRVAEVPREGRGLLEGAHINSSSRTMLLAAGRTTTEDDLVDEVAGMQTGPHFSLLIDKVLSLDPRRH
jgi:hypothetical protein